MRFLSIFKAVETGVPPTADEMAKMGQFMDEMVKAGKLLATEGLLPSAKGARIRKAGRQVTVTDGPFTDSPEVISAYAILQAGSKQEAIELTKQFLAVAGDGECEIRELYEMPAFAKK